LVSGLGIARLGTFEDARELAHARKGS
jgi:hypothetical protein